MGQTKGMTPLSILTLALFVVSISAAKFTSAQQSIKKTPPISSNTKIPSVTIPTMLPPDELSPVYLMPKEGLNRFQKMSFELELGGGVPGNKALSGISYNYGVSVHQYTGTWFDYSLYFRKSAAKGIDQVSFDTTYSEERKYSIGVMQIGIGARIRISPSQHLEVRSGFSKTSSVLAEITSTAPTGPGLEIGYEKSIPNGIPFGLLYSYEWRKAKLGGALTAGFCLSALGKNESTAELSLGLSIRFYSTPWERILQ